MLDAAIKALTQMFSPPFRSVLIRSVGLAILLLIVLGIALDRLLAWLVVSGSLWLEGAVGPDAHGPITILTWILTFAAGLGLVVGAVFLMPAVTALVASLFVDEIADHVERSNYPNDPPGEAVPAGRAVVEGIKAALLSLLVYLCALPFVLVAGLGFLIFFVATAYLLGRIYFELAAMRFHPVIEAKRLRRAHQSTVFIAGLFIAAFVSIPILSLATPLFGMALMVHVHKRLVPSHPILIEQRG